MWLPGHRGGMLAVVCLLNSGQARRAGEWALPPALSKCPLVCRSDCNFEQGLSAVCRNQGQLLLHGCTTYWMFCSVKHLGWSARAD